MVASAESVTKRSPGAVAAAPRIGADAGLTGLALAAFAALREFAASSLEIVALESRLAGSALATIAGLAVAAVLLALTAWGLGIAAVVAALIQSDISLWAALAIVAGINIALAAVLVAFMPRLARRLGFQSTRGIFKKEPAR